MIYLKINVKYEAHRPLVLLIYMSSVLSDTRRKFTP